MGKRISTLRLFSTSVVDQVLLSSGNFLVGFLLIRNTSDLDYGLFVLVQSAILLLTLAQGAWVAGPLAVVIPKKSSEVKLEMISALQRSQQKVYVLMVVVGLLAVVAGYGLGLWSGIVALAAAGGVLAAWAALNREYMRSVLMIYGRPGAVLQADVLYVLVLLFGAAIAAFGSAPAVLWAIGSLSLGAWVGAGAAYRAQKRGAGWVVGVDAAPYWRELRYMGQWAVIGSVFHWLFAQSYNYVLAARLDLSAVANFNAIRLLMMPAFVLTIGVRAMLTPSAAVWLAESGLAALLRRFVLFIVGMLAVDLVYFLIVWYFRDWLVGSVMNKVIADRDHLLILWGLIALTGLVRDMFLTALFVLGKLQSLAWLSAVSALIAISVMWHGITLWGAEAVLIGQLVGEVVSLFGVFFLLWRHQK